MEVRLWNDKRERELLDSLADLFAIIKTTEKLERAYIRDLIPSDSYESECLKLIAQFRTLSTSIASSVPSIKRFAEAYKLDCPHALNRLNTIHGPGLSAVDRAPNGGHTDRASPLLFLSPPPIGLQIDDQLLPLAHTIA